MLSIRSQKWVCPVWIHLPNVQREGIIYGVKSREYWLSLGSTEKPQEVESSVEKENKGISLCLDLCIGNKSMFSYDKSSNFNFKNYKKKKKKRQGSPNQLLRNVTIYYT